MSFARYVRALPLCLLSIGLASGAYAQSAQTWGFEDGTLQGWMATGDAFASQPTFGNNLPPRRPGEVANQQGRYWIGTYEDRPNAGVMLGRVQGDGPQGTLLSPSFTIGAPVIRFRVGGGNDREREYVALMLRMDPNGPPPARPELVLHLDDGAYFPVLRATGENDEKMQEVTWDVARFRGQVARIRIVDEASGPWGHINADDFQVNPLARATVVPPGGGNVMVGSTPGGSGPVYVPPAESGGTGTSGIVLQAPPGGATARPVARGRFRLVATSFVVEHKTVDDMLERDGRGDEIFVRGDIYEFRNGGEFGGRRTVKSLVFGAQGDIRAGTAPAPFNAADDQPGGLITNDQYPRGDNFASQPAARSGDLPMVLWEGELGERDEVLIVPSIWEWDSTQESRAETAWLAQLDRNIPRLRLGAVQLGVNRRMPTFPNGGVVSRDIVDPIYIYDDGNRPIGSMTRTPEYSSPDARMPVNAIVLTLPTAERLAGQALMFTARNFAEDGTVTQSVEYVGPPGGIEITMADPPRLEGRYALYLRLEKVN